MPTFKKDWDRRHGEFITAYKSGSDVPDGVLEEARAANVVKEESHEGRATSRSTSAADKA